MPIAYTLILALLTLSLTRSDHLAPDSPFDTYGDICFEDEKAHLDNFAIALQQNPTWVGYIVVYAGNESCGGEALYRANRAKRWVVERGISADRIKISDGGYQLNVVTLLQPWPKDKRQYEVSPGRLKIDEVKVFKHCTNKIYHPRKCPER
jgi:hypothetical protein